MVAVKGGEVDAFVRRAATAPPIVLVYGPDAGLVRERVEALVKASVDDPADPFALVRLDADALDHPGRLAEEAHTVPLFGGRRAVWLKAGRTSIAPAVEALAADPPADCRLIIEAGDLKRDSALRGVCEKARSAAALPCYEDAESALVRLIDQETREAGLTITPDARALLVSLIGGDRLASRSEVRKLTLYAHGRTRIEVDDVVAVIADASALALDGVVDAVFAGRPQEFDEAFWRVRAAGTSPDGIVIAALRHAVKLGRARLAVDDGRPLESAVRDVIGNFYKREKAVQAALASWTSPRLAKVQIDLAETQAAVRRQGATAEITCHRALLMIAQQARRRR